MIKTLFFIFSFCVSGTLLMAQNLSFNDMFSYQSKGIEYINDALTKKGWEFNTSEVNEEEGYTAVSWSLNKNTWTERAEGWFYLYQYDEIGNHLTLQTTQELFNSIKKNVVNSGYNLEKTEVIENGIKSVYHKGQIEVVLVTSKNEDLYDEDVYYLVKLYNYKKLEEYVSYLEELEKRRMLAELEKQRQAQLLEKKYNLFITTGDKMLLQKEYSPAKMNYNEALKLKPDEIHPKQKLSEIESILTFLKERRTKIYDYKKISSGNYSTAYEKLRTEIEERLKSLNENGNVKVNIIARVDTLGKVKIHLDKHTVENERIFNEIKTCANNINLPEAELKGYFVNAEASFLVDVIMLNEKITLKKNNVETVILNGSKNLRSEANSIISNAPMGKYTITLNKKSINNSDFSSYKVLNYKGTGGPSNMFLSVLVPGMGVKNVTGGSQSGWSRTLWSYGLIASGVGCKIYSNLEYDKYHEATTQTEMDNYYDNANLYNKAFYCLTAAGIAVWVYDIIWVADKGFKNKKEQKKYKMGLTYNPDTNGMLFSYSIKF